MQHFNRGNLAENLAASGPFTARAACALIEDAVLSRAGNVLSDLERTALMMAVDGRSPSVIAGTLRRSERAVWGAMKSGLRKLVGERHQEARDALMAWHNREQRDRRVIDQKIVGTNPDGTPILEDVFLHTSNGAAPEHMGHPEPVVAFDLVQPLEIAAAALATA